MHFTALKFSMNCIMYDDHMIVSNRSCYGKIGVNNVVVFKK